MKKTLLISTGGTFNKYYHPISGELLIDNRASSIEDIAKKSLCSFEYIAIIGKDSLDMDDSDRALLLESIMASKIDDIIVIHGTDTMDKSAEYIDSHNLGKQIIFTGAMVPYSIETVEATANLFLAYGYLQAQNKSGVYIAMNGVVGRYFDIEKERQKGKFIEKVKR